VAADLLDDSQGDAGVAPLREGCAAETVGASSFNADSLASFSEDDGGRVAADVSPMVPGWRLGNR
jgi:hypothetical protein